MTDRKRLIWASTFIILPFPIVFVAIFFGYEWLGRLIGLTLLFIGFPIFLIWFSLSRKNRKEYEINIHGWKNTSILKIVAATLIGLLLIHATTFVSGVIKLTHGQFQFLEGMVIKESHLAFLILFRGQYITTNVDNDKEYLVLFGDQWIRKGDHIRFLTLPGTNYILETK
jgi:membrane protease YdiL (CAAX protease family)